MWQADHTLLDIVLVGADGKPTRPWLTVVMDDCSRAICGYTVFFGAPSTMHTALALRQAIWHKTDPRWPMCGIPEVLYVDHGSDFTSDHLARTTVDLHIRLIHSAVARPQGRGKVERFFGTVNTELLTTLPGHHPRRGALAGASPVAGRPRRRGRGIRPGLQRPHPQRARRLAVVGVDRRRLAATPSTASRRWTGCC